MPAAAALNLASPAQWARLGGLIFAARRVVEGLWAGRHVSSRYGAGLEFHDYRSYAPGDDLAEVDWKLFGRTDRYYVRRHQLLTDLHAYLMLDCSASMAFSGLDDSGRALADRNRPGAISKLHYGATLAAAIAFMAIRQSDRAGLGLFGPRLATHLPPGGTWAHLQRLCAVLESGAPLPGPGDAGASLRQAHALMRRRGLVVYIGDLLDDPAPFFDGLGRFRHDRFDLIVFQVLTRQELDLASLQRLRARVQDAETQERLLTDLGRVRRRYGELLAEHLAALQRGCAARGIDYQLLTTDQPVVTALRRYLERRNAPH